ncbi:hypothetical protein [Thioclava sp. GXIMD4216]|uniref:Sulfotransferase family protein n=1 Tax=Thioclava litoralis TaxID=3076557 RepID=A0ABZ1E0F3_9RHOB|nr:hypothetical protein RPE78_11500 [Thioclava sp. FTW29]
MLIFWDQKLVFLATPKAGSTAIETALEPLASVSMQRPDVLKHMTAMDFQKHLKPYLCANSSSPFTTVALIRHPVEWLRSWYRFLLRDGFDLPDHPLHNRSFEEFALDYMQAPCPPHAKLQKQSDFLTDTAGNLLVDRLYRYEDIGNFLQFLEDRLRFEISLPRINVPPTVDTKLSAPVEARLVAFMKDDFRLYDQALSSQPN